MADVFLAVSRTTSGLEKLAVIKRLRTDLGDDAEEVAHFRGMFWDEAKLAMLLSHPNVVQTHDAFEEGKALFIVMEYIEGQSLNHVVRELARQGKRLSPVHAALVLSEVLAGLHHAHELRGLNGEPLDIVHRDVSPQNILVSYDGHVKLLDFGVAQSSTRSTTTRAGMLKGKARYMAPEQVVAKGARVDRRADIYAAGVVLWELLARRKMVEGARLVEQLVNAMKAEPERLSVVAPDVDPELDSIVHRALAREPGRRFETAQAMRDALLEYCSRREPNVRLADVAALMTQLFAKRRAEVSALVKERTAEPAARETAGELAGIPSLVTTADQSERSATSSVSSLMRGESSRLTSVSGGTLPGSLSGTPHVAAVSGVSMLPPQRTNVLSTALVAIVLVLLVVVGGLAGVVVSNRHAPAQPLITATAEAGPLKPRPAAEAHRAATTTPKSAEEPAEPSGAGVATRRTTPAAPVAVAPRWRAAAAPNPVSAPAAAPAATAPPSEDNEGFLTLDTYPWTNVSDNGHVIGNTPLVHVPLTVGTHVLTLENAADGVKQTTTVVIRRGETASKRLAF
jgi:serine/threonine-protein kinase